MITTDSMVQFISSNKEKIYRNNRQKNELVKNENNNSCYTEACQSSCCCCPCLPCFNPCGGCCEPRGPCFDPRFCDPRCNPCGKLLQCGFCMKPWLGSQGDSPLSPHPDVRNICVLPSPQPVCNPEGRCPRTLGFPLRPPRPPCIKKPPEPPKKQNIPKSVGTVTEEIKLRPRPYLLCPYFYPCPYPCSCCSGGYTPCYSDYSIGCPSTCLPRMSEKGMSVTPIPVPLPFGKAPVPVGCLEKCNVSIRDPSKNKKSLEPKVKDENVDVKSLKTEVKDENTNFNNCKACQTESPDREDCDENTFKMTIDNNRAKIIPGNYKKCCNPCSSCQPIHEWKLCRQRRMGFFVKKNKFCCEPKICNHVGCFNKPIRNTVGFLSDYSTECEHPYAIQLEECALSCFGAGENAHVDI